MGCFWACIDPHHLQPSCVVKLEVTSCTVNLMKLATGRGALAGSYKMGKSFDCMRSLVFSLQKIGRVFSIVLVYLCKL